MAAEPFSKGSLHPAARYHFGPSDGGKNRFGNRQFSDSGFDSCRDF